MNGEGKAALGSSLATFSSLFGILYAGVLDGLLNILRTNLISYVSIEAFAFRGPDWQWTGVVDSVGQ